MDENKRVAYTGLRDDVIAMITVKPRAVLDVGCSNGVFLDYAKRCLGAAYVVGIEADEAFVQVARQRADRVLKADLDSIRVEQLGPQRFDLIVLADVLEHTKNPVAVLGEVLKSGTEDVQVIISLPNIQHWTAIKNLLLGTWPLRERGLFDQTHLRFFTLKSIRALVHDCGLEIQGLKRNYRIVDAPEGKVNRFSCCFGLWPIAPFFTYQYLLRLQRIKA